MNDKSVPGTERHLSPGPVSRRAFISSAFAGAVVSTVISPEPSLSKTAVESEPIIDVNVYLSRWPLRQVRFDDTASLAAMLRGKRVTQAWAGTFDAVLQKDCGSANARLADECRRYGKGILLPFGSINPKFPDWGEELRRCSQQHGMIGIRLHPNYHGYKLDDPEFIKLLKMAAEMRLIVQMALLMEDERMMHPLMRVPQVEPAPLADVLKDVPQVPLVLLNAAGKLRGKPLSDLISAGQVFLEIATLEGVGGISNLLAQIPVDRLLFGSYAPLFYFESSLLKCKESPLPSGQLRAIKNRNAQGLLVRNR